MTIWNSWLTHQQWWFSIVFFFAWLPQGKPHMIVKQWCMKTWLAFHLTLVSELGRSLYLNMTPRSYDGLRMQCKGLGLFRLLAHGREPIHRACLHLWNRSSFGRNCGDSNLNDFLNFLHPFIHTYIYMYNLLPTLTVLFLSLCHMPIGLDRPIHYVSLYAMMWYLQSLSLSRLYIYTTMIYIISYDYIQHLIYP